MHREPVPIVHLVSEPARGATERSFFDLLTRLDRDLFAITVVVTGRGGPATRRRFTAAGLRMVHLPLRLPAPEGRAAQPRLHERLRALGALGDYLRATRPRIVHSHGPIHNIYGVLGARLAGVPHIMAHDHRPLRAGWAERLAVNVSTRLVDIAFVDSSAVGDARRALLHRGAESILCLSAGVDLQRFRPPTAAERRAARRRLGLPENAFVVGTTERYAVHERTAALLDAFPAVVAQVPNAYLLLAQDGAAGDELVARARRLDLGARLLFLDRGMRTAYRALDVFVTLRAGSAGPGRRVAEAMACGLPIVAGPGVRFGASAADDLAWRTLLMPPALGAGLVVLARSESERARLSAAARQHAARHLDMDKSAHMLEDVYAHCVARSPRPWTCRKELMQAR